ncbi:inorganic phosphate transporter [Microbacterium karelineae]|uniref:inorganic phosphate transporter n=1 Tax=Microbacterium karelineae TaxID=2654283 RepID=UPI0012EA3A91|nr:inorganic phosphate transporter [Microbacterium karelineae]
MATDTSSQAESDLPDDADLDGRDPSDRWWHLAFGALLAIAVIGFALWSLGWVSAETNRVLLITAIAFGVFMAFNIGGNDVANSFGTSVGSGTLTMKQALIVAAVFEVSGAVLAGGSVTDTVRKGIVDLQVVSQRPDDFVYIMMSALLGAALWLFLASRMGWPVSTTHSIIGGIVGASVTMGIATGLGGAEMVQWDAIGQIVLSWVVSPLLGGIVAFAIFWLIKRFILSHAVDDREEGHRALQTLVPLVAAVAAILLAGMLVVKGLHNLELDIEPAVLVFGLGMVGIAVWVGVYVFAQALQKKKFKKAAFTLFSWMQVFTASAFAFSHGANDIANAVGPFAAVLDVFRTNAVGDSAVVPLPILITFGIALLAGLWFIGRRVVSTVGKRLTEIHPASGFSAELAAAAVVMLASVLGLPVSSTHILIGAVLGVGLVNRAANWKLMKPIAMAWVITLPVAASIGAVGYLILSAIF